MNIRLETLASLVPNGRGLIDVGTDHGYLPLHLARKGYSGKLFASDINVGPLSAARRSAREADLEDRITFLLCNGLADCPQEEIDTIVVAGMGGDLICDILDRTEWCLNRRYTLILQPMTKAEVLRYWLVNNGFVIDTERLVPDGNHLYQILRASWQDRNTALTDAELFSGAFDLIRNEPLSAAWLDQLSARFSRELRGLSQGSRSREGRVKIFQQIMLDLQAMRGKIHDDGKTGF